MPNILRFALMCLHAYRAAGSNGIAYSGWMIRNVPQLCIFVGTGREAWKVSQRVMEEYQHQQER